MTQRNSLFVLLGMFLALIVLVILQSNRPAEPIPTPESQALQNRIFEWSEADIQAFSIRDPYTGATVTFQRNDANAWEFVEIPDAVPDQQGINAMAITLSVLPALEVLDQVKKEDYPEFGLTQTDAFLILIALLKNGEQHTVIVGDVASGNISHYAVVDDRPSVYVVDARPIAFLVNVLKQVYEPTPVPTQEAIIEPTP
jgi:hypothetical protein